MAPPADVVVVLELDVEEVPTLVKIGLCVTVGVLEEELVIISPDVVEPPPTAMQT